LYTHFKLFGSNAESVLQQSPKTSAQTLLTYDVDGTRRSIYTVSRKTCTLT